MLFVFLINIIRSTHCGLVTIPLKSYTSIFNIDSCHWHGYSDVTGMDIQMSLVWIFR